MSPSLRSRSLTFALAAIGWFSILLQGYLTLSAAAVNGQGIGGGLVAFFGYFTILTNLLVCLSLTFPLLMPSSPPGKYFSRPEIMAALATSIVFVGLSYHFLLRNVWHPQGAQKVADLLLHYVMPTLTLIYWWLVSPKRSLRWVDPLYWGAYPALYLAYVLIRGPIVRSYPYGFIDPVAIGYPRTMINSSGLLLVFFGLGLLLVALGRTQKHPPL
jgi:hypothetical protein